MQPVVHAVGAVIFREDGRVLLIQRGRPPAEGSWTLPGGRVEDGESAHAAVIREVLEEASLRVREARWLERVNVASTAATFAIDEFLCEVDGQDAVHGDDARACRWCDESDLESLNVTRAVRDVIRRARATVPA